MREQTLYLVDGHSLTFKAYYAIRGLRNTQGAPTGAVFGFLRMLLKILDQWSPELLAVVFDTGKPTFRKELYAKYKANREVPPPDFDIQMRWIYDLLRRMGLAVYELDGYEADDLIATMAESMKEAGGRAVIYSADKDLLQLVDNRVTVLRPNSVNEVKCCDQAVVEEILGIRPDQVADWLALVGDSSDNIPGVPGIGEKSAVELLRQHQTLENLLTQAASLTKPKQRQALLDHAVRARLARELATVKRDVPFEWNLESCRLPDKDRLWCESTIELMLELGFQSILKERGIKLPAPRSAPTVANPAPPADTFSGDFFGMDLSTTEAPVLPASRQTVIAEASLGKYVTMADESALAAWVEAALKAPWLALDTETTSTNAMTCDLVGLSLSTEPGQAIYIPVGHRIELYGETQLPLETVRRLLAPLLAGAGPRLSGHHAKFDWKVLRQAGFNPVAPSFDTMIASYLIDPDKATGHGLKALGRELCGIEMTPIKDLIGAGKKAITMAEVSVAEATRYAACDADVTLRLTGSLRARLAEAPDLERLLNEVELPLLMVLLEMEMGGFAVDVEWLRGLGGLVSQQLVELSRQIWEETGHPFNIGSTRQVAQVLYQELSLPSGKEGKMGFSTDESELERLAPLHNIPRLILEYRGLEKLKSTYIEALPLMVNPRTGRIHTSFNQTIASTGRLSSTDPNLQNIPIRTELGKSIRRAFVADGPGHLLLKADYSQIELRILAHVSRDAALCAAYQEGRDIHRQTAAEIFEVPLEAVTPQMRAQAKTINFGVIYGMSAHGLAQRLGIGRAQAARFIDRYFQGYPGVHEWMDRLLEKSRQTGWVETLLGRRRLTPELTARNGQIRANAERMAINAPIQGTSADMIKLAMIRIQDGLQAAAPGARMVCQVHDELVFSVPGEHLETASEFIRRVMIEALPLSVPIEVEVSHGLNWAENGA